MPPACWLSAEAVFHLAAQMNVRAVEAPVFDTRKRGRTVNMLEAAHQAGTPCFLFLRPAEQSTASRIISGG